MKKMTTDPAHPNWLRSSFDDFTTGEVRKAMYRLDEQGINVNSMRMAPTAYRRLVADIPEAKKVLDENTGLPFRSSLFGIPIVVDHSMPPDQIVLVKKNGSVGDLIARIEGLKPLDNPRDRLPKKTTGDGSADALWEETFGGE